LKIPERSANMKEPITRYVEDRYAKLNEFISMQPDMSELPDFEKEKGKLPRARVGGTRR
jgi:hypothetical protein